MPANDKVSNRHIQSTHADYLSRLEQQLKVLWAQYVNALDQKASDEKVKALRERYFNLYHSYRHNKQWRRVIT
jgi:hypothetical protein